MIYLLREEQLKLLSKNFEDNYRSFFGLSDEDLKEIAKWGLEYEYEYSSCWDNNPTLEEAIQCAVEDFKQFLNLPYPEGLGNFPSEPTIYRLIRLQDISRLNKNNLGLHWFSNPTQFTKEAFYDMLDYLKELKTVEGEIYLIQGKTNEDNVDIPRTLWQRSTQYNENEIFLKDGSKVKLVSIKKLKSRYKYTESINESKINQDDKIRELMLNSPDIDGFISALKLKYGNNIPLYHATTPENAELILKQGFKLQEFGRNYKSFINEPNLYFQIGKSDYTSTNRPKLIRIDVPIEFIEKYAYADMDTAWVDDDVMINHGVHPETLSSEMNDFVRYFIWNDMKLDGMEIIIEDRNGDDDIFQNIKPTLISYKNK